MIAPLGKGVPPVGFGPTLLTAPNRLPLPLGYGGVRCVSHERIACPRLNLGLAVLSYLRATRHPGPGYLISAFGNLLLRVRALNEITPKSKINYLTYRGWVKNNKPVSAPYQTLLFLKGVRP